MLKKLKMVQWVISSEDPPLKNNNFVDKQQKLLYNRWVTFRDYPERE